jgi:hypothetical protein
MPTNETTSPAALRLSLLASVYGTSVEEVLEVSTHNLLILCAYQMGKEGLPSTTLNKLLLAPSLSERLKESIPSPDYLKASADETSTKTILDAARAQTRSFTSRDLAENLGMSGAKVGQTLTAHRWPREKQPTGNEISRWLPAKQEDISVMESK